MAFGNRGAGESEGATTTDEQPPRESDERYDPVDGVRPNALPVSDASSGGEPSIREEIRDLPDDEKPDPTTIAQEEVLREPEPDEGEGDEE